MGNGCAKLVWANVMTINPQCLRRPANMGCWKKKKKKNMLKVVGEKWWWNWLLLMLLTVGLIEAEIGDC